jgi:Protein of unknown function (DUF992)
MLAGSWLQLHRPRKQRHSKAVPSKEWTNDDRTSELNAPAGAFDARLPDAFAGAHGAVTCASAGERGAARALWRTFLWHLSRYWSDLHRKADDELSLHTRWRQCAKGFGANDLSGGFNRAFVLQPYSVETQQGVNFAAGIAKVTIKAVN